MRYEGYWGGLISSVLRCVSKSRGPLETLEIYKANEGFIGFLSRGSRMILSKVYTCGHLGKARGISDGEVPS